MQMYFETWKYIYFWGTYKLYFFLSVHLGVLAPPPPPQYPKAGYATGFFLSTSDKRTSDKLSGCQEQTLLKYCMHISEPMCA